MAAAERWETYAPAYGTLAFWPREGPRGIVVHAGMLINRRLSRRHEPTVLSSCEPTRMDGVGTHL